MSKSELAAMLSRIYAASNCGTRKEFARRLDVSPTHVSRILAGREVSDDLLKLVARVFARELDACRLTLGHMLVAANIERQKDPVVREALVAATTSDPVLREDSALYHTSRAPAASRVSPAVAALAKECPSLLGKLAALAEAGDGERLARLEKVIDSLLEFGEWRQPRSG